MPKYTTEKLLRRKRLRRYWKISLIGISVVVLVYAASFWSKHPSVEIIKIVVRGNKYVETEYIEDVVKKYLDGKLLFIFNRDNHLLLSKSSIANGLEELLPVKEIRIKMHNIHTIELDVIEHKPWGLYCVEECYYVNKEGLIFFPAPQYVLEDLVRLDAILEGDVLGQIFVKSELFDRLTQMVDLLLKIDVEVSKISTEDFKTFHLSTKNGPYLLVDNRDSPIEIVNNLKTTLEQESIHDVQFQNLEYVDLRFEGKAYYKIR